MKRLSGIIVSCFFCLLIVSCNRAKLENPMETEPLYTEGIIRSGEINLHYLDWGGSGQPLVLVHGFGDSPYIFEDLAASLRSDFRVIAYSKRGHCKTVTTDSHYDNSTLVLDLKLLLDSLQISKANLLAHSMGGNDITEFAIRFPDMVDKLIYLEAGYDLSDEAFKKMVTAMPKSPFPDSTDLSSLNAYRDWYHGFWFSDIDWSPTLEANLQATIQIHPDSSISTVPDDSISKTILKTAMNYHREYVKVQAPALVVYTEPFFYPPNKDDEVIKSYENMEEEIISPWRLRSMERVRKELRKVDIRTVPGGSHTSLIFRSKALLVDAINSFLLE